MRRAFGSSWVTPSGPWCGIAVVAFAAAGCGGPSSHDSTPAPPLTASAASASLAPTASATASSVAPAASVAAGVAGDAGASSQAKTGEPSDDAMCGGSDVDLLAVLANRRCRPSRDAAATPPNASKDLKVTLVPSATTVAPGGHVDLALEIVNTGAAAIPLYFSGDLTLTPEVKDAKGTRVAPPPGNAPKSSDPKCHEVDCRPPASHVVLAPGAKAHARASWDALKRAWPKTAPAGCCIVHVDPVAAGPLPAGAYKVKLPLPFETSQGNPADPEVEIRVAK